MGPRPIQWPTFLTLLMAPVLIVMYVRLARREDQELAARFGEAFREYAARTPAFLPWARPGDVGPETAGPASPDIPGDEEPPRRDRRWTAA